MDDFNKEFKQSEFPKENNAKKFLVPFTASVLGAGLVVGLCFGIPGIKNQLLDSKETSKFQTSTSSSEISKDLIDLVEYSNTSVAVAQKVSPSIVGIKIKYSISSVFGSSEAEATGSGIIFSEDC